MRVRTAGRVRTGTPVNALIVLGAVAAPLLAPAIALAAPAVSAYIDPLEATVGDRVEVHLIVRGGEPGAAPLLPRMESWGDAEVLEVTGFAPYGAEGEAWRARLLVTSFRPGPVELPPVSLALPGEPPILVETPEGLGYTVLSVLPEGEEAVAMPPAPPRALSGTALGWWLPLALAAGALAIALALAIWLRRRRPGSPRVTRPALAPLPALLAELAELESSASMEALHTGLSLALRRYLRGALELPALERTTSEIQRSLRSAALPPALAQLLVELLRQCDGVKFARHQLTPEEATARLVTAGRLGREIDLWLQSQSPASEAA